MNQINPHEAPEGYVAVPDPNDGTGLCDDRCALSRIPAICHGAACMPGDREDRCAVIFQPAPQAGGGGAVSRKDFVYDPRLPKADLIWFRWHWFWFGKFWNKALGRDPRLPWKLLFWLPWRMANAWAVYIGPVQIGWRRPWLAGPARFEIERLGRARASEALGEVERG